MTRSFHSDNRTTSRRNDAKTAEFPQQDTSSSASFLILIARFVIL